MAKTDPIHLNIGCGTHIAPSPWWNIDVVSVDDVRPDEVVPRDASITSLYGTHSCARIYMGHVLEHVKWDHVHTYMKDVYDALVPGGELCVVGPDVLRTLERWKEGLEPWWLVRTCLEDHFNQESLGDWPEARHHWNCYEERVTRILHDVGFTDVTPLPVTVEALSDWPTVGHTPWQFAVRARTHFT